MHCGQEEPQCIQSKQFFPQQSEETISESVLYEEIIENHTYPAAAQNQNCKKDFLYCFNVLLPDVQNTPDCSNNAKDIQDLSQNCYQNKVIFKVKLNTW